MVLLDSKPQETETRDKDSKPDSRRNGQARARKCLMCGSRFPSEWAGERVCRKCKSSAAWRRG